MRTATIHASSSGHLCGRSCLSLFLVFAVHLPSAIAQSSEEGTPNDAIELVSFREEQSGRVVTITQTGDQRLVFNRGELSKPADLHYAGPVLASISAVASLWGDTEPDIAAIAAKMRNNQRSTWRFSNESSSEPAKLTQAVNSINSEGFIVIYGGTGLVSEVVYLFRKGGWEYAVYSAGGRPFQVREDELYDYQDSGMTATSPDGHKHRLLGARSQMR